MMVVIKKHWDTMHTHLDLEMDDNTYAMLAEWGRKDATDDDYVKIAIRDALKSYIDSKKEEGGDE